MPKKEENDKKNPNSRLPEGKLWNLDNNALEFT